MNMEGNPMALSPFVIFLLASLLCSIITVRLFKYDLRFDRTIDPEYYAQFPGINRATSVVKQFMRYFVLTFILTFLAIYAWNHFAETTGWTPLQPLELTPFKWSTIIRLKDFWYMACAVLAFFTIIDIVRCLVSPVRTDLTGRWGHWDVFISYKSEDVEFARQVADQLLASGIKVWFGEYQVLLQNYDQFQQAIDFGIDNCDWGIALTNDRYTHSPYCCAEITHLLQHLPPQHILEIMVPAQEQLPHQKFQALADCPAYIGTDLPGMLAFIAQHTGWQIQPLLPEVVASQPRLHEFMVLGRPATLDARDWELSESGRVLDGTTDLIAFNYFPRRDQYHMLVNVVCGREYAREGQRQNQTSDDRQMYALLRAHAQKHLATLKAQIYGLHLVFHDQLSQFALTYRMRGYWSRKYSIIIPNPVTGQMAEFVFTFGFLGTFEQYCSNTHIMDHFVQTLQWS